MDFISNAVRSPVDCSIVPFESVRSNALSFSHDASPSLQNVVHATLHSQPMMTHLYHMTTYGWQQELGQGPEPR
jgi:hypothetical protein